MAIRKMVVRPLSYDVIQWNTDEDRLQMFEVFMQYDFLYEFHEHEFMAPEHIIFGNLKMQGLLLKGNYLVVTDKGELRVMDEEMVQQQLMPEEEFDKMISWRMK